MPNECPPHIPDSQDIPVDYRAAALSGLIPALGQVIQGRSRQALAIFGSGLLILACVWGVVRLAGASAAIFFLMLVVLPAWVVQSYDAGLGPTSEPSDMARTLRAIWARAHDIRYLGALFLLTAFTDFYIIVANPTYALTLFCSKPAGMLGILAKAQSPTLHILIGYGFMRLRRWSLLLYLAYAGFGFINATANFACFGYGRVRSVFLVTLLGFTVYIWWRRRCFLPSSSNKRPSLGL
ncbi:MAG: hypothetical protein ACT4OO_08625 [Nitrospiraceae bacterium]